MIANNRSQTKWRPTTGQEPCPACGKHGWCAWAPDGLLNCKYGGVTPNGMKYVKEAKEGKLYAFDDSSNDLLRRKSPSSQAASVDPSIDFSKVWQLMRQALTNDLRNELVNALQLPISSLAHLDVGWADLETLRQLKAGGRNWHKNQPTGAFTFAERDGAGRMVGFSLRTRDGRKGFPSGKIGAARGLVIPSSLSQHVGLVLIVEGASDVAACAAMGLIAVGRPSCNAGADNIARMLEGRDVLVVGERDQKGDGRWPGRDGARSIAENLTRQWRIDVSWTLPPSEAKDIRDWLIGQDIPRDNVEALNDTGKRLLAALRANAHVGESEGSGPAEELVRMVLGGYRLGRSDEGDTFVVEADGPNVAHFIDGNGGTMRQILARDGRRRCGRTVTASAVSEAIAVVQGEALTRACEPVHVRVAPYIPPKNPDSNISPGERGVVVDLGDEEGRAVVIESKGWGIVDRSPALFRRTKLFSPLPTPLERVGFDELNRFREFLNISDDTWPLLAGWMVAALIPWIPHPILLLGGEQGTGKSTAARLIGGLIDPSPALLRSEPRDGESWAISAAGSWVVALDNISRIAPWLSDTLCKAVTGDGIIRRSLYTNRDLSVLQIRRPIILTSIDAGALRGDLGERLLRIDLDRIPGEKRQTEIDLNKQYALSQPGLLGALFGALSETLRGLGRVVVTDLPRMADFANVLAALDHNCPQLTGGRALDLYQSQLDRILEDVVDGDPVAAAIRDLVANREVWKGTCKDLCGILAVEAGLSKPNVTPHSMARILKRIMPALRQIGIHVEIRNERSNRGRVYSIFRVTTSQSSHHHMPDGNDKELSHESDVSDVGDVPHQDGDLGTDIEQRRVGS